MVVKLENGKDKNYFSRRVLIWHKKDGRHDLPWQKRINPYRVWISEIMLQQTQVSVVIPYYLKFIESYPNLKILSNTTLKKVMNHWEGLGYYSRVKNFKESCDIICKQYNGKIPQNYNEFIKFKSGIKKLLNTNLFKNGSISIQDPAAGAVVELLDLKNILNGPKTRCRCFDLGIRKRKAKIRYE